VLIVASRPKLHDINEVDESLSRLGVCSVGIVLSSYSRPHAEHSTHSSNFKERRGAPQVL
jgi:hypothetical protein